MSKEERRVTIKMIMWIIGTMIAVWGCAYGYTWRRLEITEAKTELVLTKYENVNSQLSQIQTNVEWIKETMKGNYNQFFL